MKRSDLQARIATASFCVAVAFSTAGFIVSPLGDLTEANLYLVAQFLLVTTSIFGVSSIVSKRIQTKQEFDYERTQPTTERVEE